jgi:tetratricopeptide (TPR) repeat protein
LVAAGDSHGQFFGGFLSQQLAQLKGGRQSEALQAITADMANVRAAWRWASARGRTAVIEHSVDTLLLFYDMQGWYHEGAEIFARSVEVWEAAAPEESADDDQILPRLMAGQAFFLHHLGLNERAQTVLRASLDRLLQTRSGESPPAGIVMYALGRVNLDLGVYAAARDWLEKSLKVWSLANDDYWSAAALDGLGAAAHALGDYTLARNYYDQALSLRRGLGDQHGMLASLTHAGELALEIGEKGAAQILLDESVTLAASLGRRWAKGANSRSFGLLALARGSTADARRLFDESLAFNQESGNRKEIALDLLALASLAAASGDDARAQTLLRQSLDLFHETGYRRGLSLALTGLGQRASRSSDGAAIARGYFEEALQTALEIGALPSALAAVVGLAALSLKAGRLVLAAEALTCALYHPSSNRGTQDRAAELLSRLEAELPPAEVADAEERGRRGRLDELVAALVAA